MLGFAEILGTIESCSEKLQSFSRISRGKCASSLREVRAHMLTQHQALAALPGLKSARLDQRQCLLVRSEEHTSELQSRQYLVCRLLLEKKKKSYGNTT